MNYVKKILPGFLICVVLAQIGLTLGKIIPGVGGAPIAILLGMVVGNTIATGKIFSEGTKFSESSLLSYSIVLLGGTLSINTIFKLGMSGILFIILQMLSTILISMYVGKKLGFSKYFRALISSGNAVCGSSAIGAVSLAIKANDDDKGVSITIVNLIGTILMFTLIPISALLFDFETIKTSALLGGILQSVGQVIAAGSMVNKEVLEMATLFKIVRIIFLVVVVIWLSKKFDMEKVVNNRIENNEDFTNITNGVVKKNRKFSVPWYITGFFILCTLFTIGIIPAEISKIFKLISSKFEIIALAGIGMRVNFKELLKQGPKALLYGLIVGVGQVVTALLLIQLLVK